MSQSLQQAARRDDVQTLRELLKTHASDAGAALVTAVHFNHADCVRALLDAGTSVNVADVTGSTPLIAAATSGNTAMVETLLAAGADVDAVGGDMRTTALIEAAHYADDANCVALLAERANDVDATNKYGDTALFFAVQGVNVASVEVLLARGASVNRVADDGSTPLHRAAEKPPSPTLLALLLERGADPNPATEDGVTCLMKAASARSPDMVTALVERGADVSAADHDEGRTALHYAIRVEVPFDGDFSEGDAPEMPDAATLDAQMTETAEVLLNAGAPVNAQDAAGYTALHMCASGGYPACARLLVARGADAALQNADGETPIALAEKFSNAECVQLLRDAGADAQ